MIRVLFTSEWGYHAYQKVSWPRSFSLGAISGKNTAPSHLVIAVLFFLHRFHGYSSETKLDRKSVHVNVKVSVIPSFLSLPPLADFSSFSL